LAQRAQQALERLAERGIAVVGEPGAALRLGEDVFDFEAGLGRHDHPSLTRSTSLPSTERSASRSSPSGSAPNPISSSGARSAPRARCASSCSCAAAFVSRPYPLGITPTTE